MASDLPLTLRVYRSLSTVATPLAGALVKHRLKRGKEDEARVGERKGLSATERPPGPLVWIHGASVGEVLAVAGLVERMRAMNIRILLTSGTVTSAAIVARRFPPDVIHQFIPYDFAALRGALPRSLAAELCAVRGIRSLAQPDPRRAPSGAFR